ncbi:hypothetical protein DPMN_184823 [Dreissena polymorpha]|uniref:Sushi domain-containing protein n=1 Tax=Dreissena polymorpha TaxID=45954 RepID=A0A9D4DJY7_DREPO|nr:hypothetical protein DPMN_184823 [Dreissena polymorpha]
MFDKVLVYECNSGYYPRPNDEPKCRVDGMWSSGPECYKHCENPPGYNWGTTLFGGHSAPYTVESWYTFECKNFPFLPLELDSKEDGFNRNDCKSDGTWTDRIGCCPFGTLYSGGGNACSHWC